MKRNGGKTVICPTIDLSVYYWSAPGRLSILNVSQQTISPNEKQLLTVAH